MARSTRASARPTRSKSIPDPDPAPAPPEQSAATEAPPEKPSPVHPLAALFPLAAPPPDPRTCPDLIDPADLPIEEELLRSPADLRAWLAYLARLAARASIIPSSSSSSTDPPDDSVEASLEAVTGTGLRLPAQRAAYRALVYVAERALVYHPTSYKLWYTYLDARLAYLYGARLPHHTSRSRKEKAAQEQEEAEEDGGETRTPLAELDTKDPRYRFASSPSASSSPSTKDDQSKPVLPLNALVGSAEYMAMAGAFERALSCLPTMPKLWALYFSFLSHPACHHRLASTHARRTFDRALRTLPPSLHPSIWAAYLKSVSLPFFFSLFLT